MKFWLATAAWTGIAFLLGLSIYLLVVKSMVWFFALVVIGLILAIAKIGCAH